MTSTPGLKPSDLDLAVADRQTSGVSYSRPSKLDLQVNRLRASVLRLAPHGDWSGSFTDWSADPFHDRNWQFQFHTLRWLNPLRWAALEGDEGSRVEWLRVARSWFEANVPATSARSLFAWKDMADGNRAIQLSLGAPLTTDKDEWFVDLLQYHRDWLMDAKHIVGKNHGLHQHAGLLVVGAVLRDREATDTAVARMEKQFLTTFDDQGCNDEGSTGYHQLNLRWWRQAWDRAEAEGYTIPAGVADRLAAGARALAHYALPDGQLPQIGDTARGPVDSGLHPHTDFAASAGATGEPPEETALVLDGGYVISRSGWGADRPMEMESHMILRHGIDVKAHSHHDLGSLHIYSSGNRWLTDSGFHSYQTQDPTRRYLNSRQAHNIAFLPGRAHDDSSPVDLASHSITDTVHDFTIVDKGYKSDDLRRRVLYFSEADCWFVIDSSLSHGETKLAQHWHLEPTTDAWFRDNGFRLRRGKHTMSMTWLGKRPNLTIHKAVEGDLTGWIGTRWKTLTAGARITATTPSSTTNRLIALIAPNSPRPLGVVDSRVTLDGSVSATIVRGDSAWNIRIDTQGAGTSSQV